MRLSLSPLIVFACRVAETRSISRYDASRRVYQFIWRKKCPRRVSMTLLSHWHIDICMYQRHITRQKITYIWFPSPLSKTAADYFITAPARTITRFFLPGDPRPMIHHNKYIKSALAAFHFPFEAVTWPTDRIPQRTGAGLLFPINTRSAVPVPPLLSFLLIETRPAH